MKDFILQVLVAGGVMGILDAVWLSLIANGFYKSQLGKLLLDKPNMGPAILFYAIYVVGVVALVISPAISKGSWQYALGFGALLGLVAYATYDLTNLATIKGFSTKVTVVDLLWGSFLTGTVALATYLIVTKWIS